MESETKPCPICAAVASKQYVGLKGYIEGTAFDVFVCGGCNASFVSPMQEAAGIYDYIYSQCEHIPGYERYYRYSQLVLKSKNPLVTLANAESSYWAVYNILEENFGKQKTNVSVLEVGSGLGYLTYSLHKSGYQVTGLDISLQAVEDAQKRYGNLYSHADLFDLAEKQEKKYDCIIMMEVIEHVTNPADFLSAATALLNPGGKLIITTPNKTAVPSGVNSVWQSDFPPVHFWFFTEESIKILIKKTGKSCTLFNFTNYNKKFFSPQYDSSIEKIQIGLPRLLKNGTINPQFVADQTKSKYFGIYGRYVLSYIRRRLKKKSISEKSTTMCIVVE